MDKKRILDWRDEIEKIYLNSGSEIAINQSIKSVNVPLDIRKLSIALLFSRVEKFEDSYKALKEVDREKIKEWDRQFELDALAVEVNYKISIKEYQEALFGIEKALVIQPENINFFTKKLFIFHKIQPNKVKNLFLDEIKNRPSNDLLLAAYGNYLLLEGDYKKAEEIARKALTINENNIEANEILGLLFFEGKEYDQATFYLRKVIALNPNMILTQEILCEVVVFSEGLDAGERQCHYALGFLPENSKIHSLLACVILEKGDDAHHALMHAKKGVLYNPDAYSLFAQAYSYTELNQLFLADEALKKCLKFSDAPKSAYRLRSILDEKLGINEFKNKG